MTVSTEEELVLLTSYFNLVDGRRQDTADTFRVDPNLPSGTSPDGSAALYVVTEASSSGQMGPRARRLVADTVAWEYEQHGEDPPAARLRAALRTAHQEILREFDGHVSVGVTVIAVEQENVYLGQVAPGQVYVLHEGGVHSIAASAGGTSPFGRALGSRAGPRISVFRDRIGPEDVLSICSSWFERGADTRDIRACFSAGTADDIADALLDLAKDHDVREATAIVIEAARASEVELAPDREAPQGFMEQVDAAMQALAGFGRMIWGELRSQPGAAEPDGNRARRREEALPRTSPPSAAAGAGAGATFADMDEMGSQGAAGQPETAARREQVTDEVPSVPQSEVETERLPGVEPEPGVTQAEVSSDLDRINTRIQAEPEMEDVIPPVQTFPEASTQPERIYATSKDIEAVNKRPRRFGGRPRPPVLSPGTSDVDLSRPAARPAPPAVVWASIAAVCVLAVLALIVFYKNHQSSASAHPAAARQDIRAAAVAKSPTQQDLYLKRARQEITLAKADKVSPVVLHGLNRDLQQTSDSIYKVTREAAPVVVADFSKFAGSKPTEMITGGSRIVVLDTGRKSAFSVTPNSRAAPTEFVKDGDQVAGITVGIPQQVTTDAGTALVLDSSNNLISNANDTNTAILLTPGAQNQKVNSMASLDPDVYLLDPVNSQIWRYPGAASGTSPTPSPFFPSNAAKLSQPVSMALDGTDIYVLEASGNILKYDNQANPQKYTTALRVPLKNPVSVFTDVNLNYVWVADPANQRIVQLDKNGNYIRSYASGTPAMNFGQLRGMAVFPKGNTIYVLAGTKIFDFPLAP